MNYYKLIVTARLPESHSIDEISAVLKSLGVNDRVNDLENADQVLIRHLGWQQAEAAKAQLQAVGIICAIYVDDALIETVAEEVYAGSSDATDESICASDSVHTSVSVFEGITASIVENTSANPQESSIEDISNEDTPTSNENHFPIISPHFSRTTTEIENAIPQQRPNRADWKLGAIKSLPVGHGIQWLIEGVQLFKLAPIHWIGGLFVMLCTIWLLGMIPFFGGFLVNFIWPIHLASSANLCRLLHERGGFDFDDLFYGFRQGTFRIVAASILCGLFISASLILSLGLIVGHQALDFMLTFDPTPLAHMVTPMLGMAALLGFMLVAPIAMAFYFAPILIVMHNVSTIRALYLSFVGCMKNLLPLTLYSFAMLLAMIVASIPAMLGWIILLPLLATSIFASYRQIFTNVEPI